MKFSLTPKRLWLGALALVLLLLPVFVKNNYTITTLVYCFIFSSLAVSWNLIGGYGGQTSWCHAVFVAVGAYTSMILFKTAHISPFLTIFMLAIARALQASPKLLMLDEPSLGLAPIIVESMFEIISNVAREGVSILIVEQNLMQALSVADRGYVMENGHVVLQGTAEELMNNEEVKAAYLGI